MASEVGTGPVRALQNPTDTGAIADEDVQERGLEGDDELERPAPTRLLRTGAGRAGDGDEEHSGERRYRRASHQSSEFWAKCATEPPGMARPRT